MHKRILVYDILRSLLVIYIVCGWHLLDYIPKSDLEETIRIYGEDITRIVLACFTLISGLFLSKYKITGRRDILNFYLKRLGRFYILYVIALLLFLVTSPPWGERWLNARSFCYSIFAISTLFNIAPSTLWYINMLMLFYIVTSLILKYNTNGKLLIISALVILLNSANVDNRILLYFHYYIIGLVLGPHRLYDTLKNQKCFLCALLIFVALCYFPYFNGIKIFAGVILLISAVFFIEPYIKIQLGIFFSQVSYVSMSAYLFHRPLYYFFQKANIPLILCSILVFVIAYFIQRAYDFIYNKIQNKIDLKCLHN